MKNGAFKIAILYFLVGMVWIYFSDTFLNLLQIDQEVAEIIQTFKGFGYVTLTAVLLYFLVQRHNNKIKERETFLRSLIASQSNFLIRMNKEGVFTFVNKALGNLLRKNGHGIIGKSFIDVIAKKDLIKFKESTRTSLTKPGKVVNATLTINNNDQHALLTEWEFIGIRNQSGEVQEIQGVGHDITERFRYFMQIKEYKERLENILSTVSNVIWSLQAEDLKLLFISSACINFYGYDPLDFYEHENLWMEIILNQDRNTAIDKLKHMPKNKPVDIEFRVRHQDGSIRHIHSRFNFVAGDDKKGSVINGISTDVTKVKLAEAKANEYATQLAEILENMDDGFFTVDSDWNFTYINKEFENIIGVQRGDILGKNILDIFPQMINNRFVGSFQNAIQQQSKVSLEEYFPSLKKWFRLSAYPGNKGISVYLQDISNERELLVRMNVSQKNISALINNTNDLIWSIDKNYCLLSANDAFFEQTKSESGSEIKVGDKIFSDQYPGSLKQKWDGYYRRALAGEAYRVEENSIDQNGKEQYVEVSFNPIVNRDEVIGVGCFSRKITEQKIFEDHIKSQNEKLREIAFVHSHILRRPVATILGLISIFDKNNFANDFNATVMEKLQITAAELDEVIRNIVKKTNELEKRETEKA